MTQNFPTVMIENAMVYHDLM